MKKINISLIEKYVNKKNLGEYTKEQLENDTNFMINVIKYTNDFKMYYACSEKVKKDYELVKYLVLKFKNNTNFINTVAKYYIDNVDTDWERKELGIIMEKILPKDLSEEYNILNEANYESKRLEIEILKCKDKKLEIMLDMGFVLIYDEYSGSDIILNYYIDCLLKEIIKENNIDFEKMLHKQFRSADKIKKLGINNYITDFIRNYDFMLSSYICVHIDLVKPLANKIKSIIDNWDTYCSKDEKKRYNNMLDMVHEFMQINDSDISESEILYYVANELGITEKVKQYDGTKNLENELGYELDYDIEVLKDMVEFTIERNLKERLIYSKVKKIMINQLFSDDPLDLDSLIDEEKEQSSIKDKCKIIKLKANEKEKNKQSKD